MSDRSDKVVKGPGTLASAAYERLRGEVMTAQLLPGQKLNIRQLCARYEMGLSPLREALNRLSRDGLVMQSDQQGFRVAPIGIAQLDELTRTRCWLNELALRESIAHGDAAWEESVLLACHRLLRLPRQWSDEDSPLRNVGWEEAHRAFHASLLAACRSQWLITFCEQLFDAAERYRHISRISRSERRQDEHKQIMEATVARDVELAVKLLTAHFWATAERARERLAALEADNQNNGIFIKTAVPN
jgi:GntR family transcriptional regulator, carbon starvation induced regulator